MNKKLIWESQHLEIDPISNKIKSYDEEYDKEEPTNVTATPFGVWKVDDAMHPLKQFKLWMAHTNFNITQRIAHTINVTSGVELLRIFSPYRFIVGIGKAFDVQEVKDDIENRICDRTRDEISISRIKNEGVVRRVTKIKEFLNKQYKKWSLIVFPNGNIDFSVSSGNANYDKESRLFKKIAETSNSILLEKENGSN